VRQRSGQLLFERQEEAGSQRERGDPQAGNRLHGLVAAEGHPGHLQEEVAADAGDEETDSYGKGAFWKRGSPTRLVERELRVGRVHQISEASCTDPLAAVYRSEG
jgi:hypothetical protein